jgi:predicted DNA-binding protein
MKIGKRLMMPIYLDPPQMEKLKRLSAATGVSMAAYLREAVDDLFIKHAKELRQPRNKPRSM